LSAISAFRHFGDWRIEKAEVLDIRTQEVLKPEITLWEKIAVIFEVRVEVKDLWIKDLRFQ
jgi:hypothetical protein